MEKIPCIKCTFELWKYIRHYLEEWGYKPASKEFINFEQWPLLVINSFDRLGYYNSDGIVVSSYCNRELVTNVEEFLERAAKLKGFTYKRKDMNNFTKDDLKSGMVVRIRTKEMYLVVGDKIISNAGFMYLRSYDMNLKCTTFSKYDIIEVYDNVESWGEGFSVGLSDAPNYGKLIWERVEPKEYTMQEIAYKLGIPVEQLRIKK